MAVHQSNSSEVFYHPSESFINRQLLNVDEVLMRVNRTLDALPKLFTCQFDSEFGCGELGVVTDLDSEREYCGKHFREVSQ